MIKIPEFDNPNRIAIYVEGDEVSVAWYNDNNARCSLALWLDDLEGVYSEVKMGAIVRREDIDGDEVSRLWKDIKEILNE